MQVQPAAFFCVSTKGHDRRAAQGRGQQRQRRAHQPLDQFERVVHIVEQLIDGHQVETRGRRRQRAVGLQQTGVHQHLPRAQCAAAGVTGQQVALEPGGYFFGVEQRLHRHRHQHPARELQQRVFHRAFVHAKKRRGQQADDEVGRAGFFTQRVQLQPGRATGKVDAQQRPDRHAAGLDHALVHAGLDLQRDGGHQVLAFEACVGQAHRQLARERDRAQVHVEFDHQADAAAAGVAERQGHRRTGGLEAQCAGRGGQPEAGRCRDEVEQRVDRGRCVGHREPIAQPRHGRVRHPLQVRHGVDLQRGGGGAQVRDESLHRRVARRADGVQRTVDQRGQQAQGLIAQVVGAEAGEGQQADRRVRRAERQREGVVHHTRLHHQLPPGTAGGQRRAQAEAATRPQATVRGPTQLEAATERDASVQRDGRGGLQLQPRVRNGHQPQPEVQRQLHVARDVGQAEAVEQAAQQMGDARRVQLQAGAGRVGAEQGVTRLQPTQRIGHQAREVAHPRPLGAHRLRGQAERLQHRRDVGHARQQHVVEQGAGHGGERQARQQGAQARGQVGRQREQRQFGIRRGALAVAEVQRQRPQRRAGHLQCEPQGRGHRVGLHPQVDLHAAVGQVQADVPAHRERSRQAEGRTVQPQRHKAERLDPDRHTGPERQFHRRTAHIAHAEQAAQAVEQRAAPEGLVQQRHQPGGDPGRGVAQQFEPGAQARHRTASARLQQLHRLQQGAQRAPGGIVTGLLGQQARQVGAGEAEHAAQLGHEGVAAHRVGQHPGQCALQPGRRIGQQRGPAVGLDGVAAAVIGRAVHPQPGQLQAGEQARDRLHAAVQPRAGGELSEQRVQRGHQHIVGRPGAGVGGAAQRGQRLLHAGDRGVEQPQRRHDTGFGDLATQLGAAHPHARSRAAHQPAALAPQIGLQHQARQLAGVGAGRHAHAGHIEPRLGAQLERAFGGPHHGRQRQAQADVRDRRARRLRGPQLRGARGDGTAQFGGQRLARQAQRDGVARQACGQAQATHRREGLRRPDLGQPGGRAFADEAPQRVQRSPQGTAQRQARPQALQGRQGLGQRRVGQPRQRCARVRCAHRDETAHQRRHTGPLQRGARGQAAGRMRYDGDALARLQLRHALQQPHHLFGLAVGPGRAVQRHGAGSGQHAGRAVPHRQLGHHQAGRREAGGAHRRGRHALGAEAETGGGAPQHGLHRRPVVRCAKGGCEQQHRASVGRVPHQQLAPQLGRDHRLRQRLHMPSGQRRSGSRPAAGGGRRLAGREHQAVAGTQKILQRPQAVAQRHRQHARQRTGHTLVQPGHGVEQRRQLVGAQAAERTQIAQGGRQRGDGHTQRVARGRAVGVEPDQCLHATRRRGAQAKGVRRVEATFALHREGQVLEAGQGERRVGVGRGAFAVVEHHVGKPGEVAQRFFKTQQFASAAAHRGHALQGQTQPAQQRQRVTRVGQHRRHVRAQHRRRVGEEGAPVGGLQARKVVGQGDAGCISAPARQGNAGVTG